MEVNVQKMVHMLQREYDALEKCLLAGGAYKLQTGEKVNDPFKLLHFGASTLRLYSWSSGADTALTALDKGLFNCENGHILGANKVSIDNRAWIN